MARLTKKQTQELKRILVMLNEAHDKVQEPIPLPATPLPNGVKIYPKIPIALVTAQSELNSFIANNQFKNQYGVTPQ